MAPLLFLSCCTQNTCAITAHRFSLPARRSPWLHRGFLCAVCLVCHPPLVMPDIESRRVHSKIVAPHFLSSPRLAPLIPKFAPLIWQRGPHVTSPNLLDPTRKAERGNLNPWPRLHHDVCRSDVARPRLVRLKVSCGISETTGSAQLVWVSSDGFVWTSED